jgi:hypothetical protein
MSLCPPQVRYYIMKDGKYMTVFSGFTQLTTDEAIWYRLKGVADNVARMTGGKVVEVYV